MEGAHIVVTGAGATGSHLLPQIARMPQVTGITIADPDSYGYENLASQNIDRLDLGKPKAVAQCQKLRLINPRLRVDAFVGLIQDMPLGLLAGAVLLSCGDDRTSRQRLNEIACRLSAVLIDMGVLGSQNLARVSAYLPSENAPCLECNWGPDEYAQIEQEYPCANGTAAHRPSMASSALAGLAAAMAAIEVAKILSGDLSAAAAGREVVIDAQHHRMLVTDGRRLSGCRFDHRRWTIDPWQCDLRTTAVRSAIEKLGTFRVDGHRFVTRLICPACGLADHSLKLNRPPKMCLWCRRRMVTQDFDVMESLGPDLRDEYQNLTLAGIGLREGDVLTCGDCHFNLTEKA